MATLTGKKIKDSYAELLKLDSSTPNEGATASLKAVETGEGTDTALSLSTAQIASSVDGSAGTPAITRSSDPNTGIFFPAADTIAASTGGTEAMRINSSGNVGIGTASPAGKLHVNGQTYIQGAVSGGLANSTLIANSSGQAQIWALGSDVSTRGSMSFVVGRSDLSNSNEALRIDSSGQTGIGVTPTSRNNTRLQIVDGIGFPSTQVASSDANTLDDYEEGTWTPNISFGGASAGITSDAANGLYVKIGRQVTVSGAISMTSKGSSTGNARITGLPFTTQNSYYNPAATLYIYNTTFANVPFATVIGNSTTIALSEVTEAGGLSTLTDADFSNTSFVQVFVTYFV